MLREIVERKKLEFEVDDVLVVDSKTPKKAYFTVVHGISQHGDYWLLNHGDYDAYEVSPKKIENTAIRVGHKNSFDFGDAEGWVEWNLATSDRK